MLNKISWGQYFTIIVLVMIIYYSYIVLNYYGDEFKALLKEKRKNHLNPIFSDEELAEMVDERIVEHPAEEKVPFEETSDDTFDRIELLIVQIKPAIEYASENGLNDKELKTSLNEILSGFNDLKNSPFMPAISELIQTECKNIGSIVLSEDEVRMLWGD